MMRRNVHVAVHLGMINQFQEYCKKYTGYYLKAIDELAVVRCDNLYKKYNGLENPKIIFSKVLIYYYGLAVIYVNYHNCT